MSSDVDLYGAAYRGLASALYADIRREAFGEDIGQTGWLTTQEQDHFIGWLALSPSSRLLDVACGSGRPTLRIAEKTSCRVFGLDLHGEGIANAQASAKELGYEGRAEFVQGDAAERLPFDDMNFDALICIDRSIIFPIGRPSLRSGGACSNRVGDCFSRTRSSSRAQ